MATDAIPLTIEQFVAIPDDESLERELIQGEVHERPMTRRDRQHSQIVASLSYLLLAWLKQSPQSGGKVFSGEVGVILRRNPDSLVGIDVAYFSSSAIAQCKQSSTVVEGLPTLAIEVLSPSDRLEDIYQKVDEYLAVGVDAVWIVDPHFRTVTEFRAGEPATTFNDTATIKDRDYLPGFQAAIREVFDQ